MYLRRSWLIWLLFSTLAAVSCDSTVSNNADDYVGEYVFMPADATTGDFASFVILKTDRSSVGFRFSKTTGAVLTTQENWYLQFSTGPDIVIGKRSYPIHRSGSTIRLVINDMGQYYEKVR
jgi:hypothetical protein